MSNEITVGDAEPTTETAAEQSNMSVTDFINRRLGQAEEKAPEAEANVEATNEVVEEAEVESKELSEKLGSRAVARFGELTAKRKAAEEKLKAMEAQLQTKNPLETQQVANNPYESVDSLEGLQEKAQEVTEVIEWAEEMLFNADGYGPEDVVTEVEGKELTKADVRKSLLNARKARDKFLPAQLKTLQTVAQSKQLKEAFDTQATQELDWLQGDDNDTRKNYEAMVGDSRFQKLLDKAEPEIGAQLNYIMAHAANSIYGRKTIKNSPTSTKLSPPKTAISAASTSEKTVGKSAKALKSFNQQFRQSGNKSDFIALRTLQLKNKQS